MKQIFDIYEEVEKHIPESLHLRRIFNRPKFGEWVTTNAKMVRVMKEVEGLGTVAYWEAEQLPQTISGLHTGHRFMPFGIVQKGAMAKVDYHGGTSVALITYAPDRDPMYIPWSEIADVENR